jgi:hypothetical protein
MSEVQVLGINKLKGMGMFWIGVEWSGVKRQIWQVYVAVITYIWA